MLNDISAFFLSITWKRQLNFFKINLHTDNEDVVRHDRAENETEQKSRVDHHGDEGAKDAPPADKCELTHQQVGHGHVQATGETVEDTARDQVRKIAWTKKD